MFSIYSYYERLLSELIAKNLEMGEILIKTNDDLTIAKEEFTKADDNISILEKDLRKYLDFEKKIANLDNQMSELRKLSYIKGIDYSAEIRKLQKQQVVE